jgi:hypothetical protein
MLFWLGYDPQKRLDNSCGAARGQPAQMGTNPSRTSCGSAPWLGWVLHRSTGEGRANIRRHGLDTMGWMRPLGERPVGAAGCLRGLPDAGCGK